MAPKARSQILPAIYASSIRFKYHNRGGNVGGPDKRTSPKNATTVYDNEETEVMDTDHDLTDDK